MMAPLTTSYPPAGLQTCTRLSMISWLGHRALFNAMFADPAKAIGASRRGIKKSDYASSMRFICAGFSKKHVFCLSTEIHCMRINHITGMAGSPGIHSLRSKRVKNHG